MLKSENCFDSEYELLTVLLANRMSWYTTFGKTPPISDAEQLDLLDYIFKENDLSNPTAQGNIPFFELIELVFYIAAHENPHVMEPQFRGTVMDVIIEIVHKYLTQAGIKH